MVVLPLHNRTLLEQPTVGFILLTSISWNINTRHHVWITRMCFMPGARTDLSLFLQMKIRTTPFFVFALKLHQDLIPMTTIGWFSGTLTLLAWYSQQQGYPLWGGWLPEGSRNLLNIMHHFYIIFSFNIISFPYPPSIWQQADVHALASS